MNFITGKSWKQYADEKCSKYGKYSEYGKYSKYGKCGEYSKYRKYGIHRNNGNHRLIAAGKGTGKGETDSLRNYRVYHMNGKEGFLCFAEYAGIVGFIDMLCYCSFWPLLPALPAGVFFWNYKRREGAKKSREMLRYHFLDAMQAMLTAVRAGYAMESAVAEGRKELERIYGRQDDMVKELRFMEQQMHVGVPVEQLFFNLGQRSDVEEIRNFGEIFLIARRSGGKLDEIMEKLVRVLGEKIRVSREIEVRIAGKKMEQTVMSLAPGGMILYMKLTSPGFLDVLYHNAAGVLVMTLCLAVYGTGFWMGRKIVRISV